MLQGGRFQGLPELLWGLEIQVVLGHLDGEETVTTRTGARPCRGAAPTTPGTGKLSRVLIIHSANIYWYHLSYQGSPFSSLQGQERAHCGFCFPEIVERLGTTS